MNIDIEKSEFVYVIGNPRSGTSLLRLMLNSHEDITVPPECGFLHWLSNKYHSKDFTKIINFIDDYLFDLQRSRKIETWDIDFSLLRKNIMQILPNNYYELSILVYLSYAMKFDKFPSIVGDKNNYYINYLEELDALVPNAKYLYIVRDCRDVVNSYKELQNLKTESLYKPNLPADEEEIAKIWLANNTNVFKFFNTIDSNRYFIIKFEDLVSESKINLKKICDWLHIEFDDRMMRYYLDNYQNNIEPLSTLNWKRDTLQKPNPDKIGIYRKKINIKEVEKINNVAGNMLKYLGYI